MNILRKLVLLSFALPACGHAAEPMLFVMEEFPPFVMRSQGEPAGVFPDIVRATCAALHTPCKLEIFPWRRAYSMALNGQADGIVAIIGSEQRARDFYLSPPLVNSAYAVYAQHDVPASDFSGYTVASYGPSGTSAAAQEWALQHANTRLVVELDNETALRKLKMGRYGEKGALVINQDVGQYLMRQDGDAGLKHAGEIKKITYHIGLSRKRLPPAQAEAFLQALRAAAKDGSLRAIIERHNLKPAP